MKITSFTVAAIGVFAVAAIASSNETPEWRPDDDASFADRVTDFWEWFGENQAELHANMFDESMIERAEEVSEAVERFSPDIGWTFGPGREDGEHALQFATGGDKHLRLLAQVIVDMAPSFDGWVFQPSKPPGVVDGNVIGMVGHEFAFDDMRLAVEVDDKHSVVHLVAYHPMFAKLPEDLAGTLMFLAIDEALGEDGTELWVGRIDTSKKPLGDDAKTLVGFKKDVPALAAEKGWPTTAGFNLWSVYEREHDDEGNHPRSDVYLGSSCMADLVHAYYKESGKPKDPLRGLGARYAFIQIPRAALEFGDAEPSELATLDLRNAIVDTLNASVPSARLTGQAIGTENIYIDVLLLDAEKATTELREALAKNDSASSATLLSFTRGGPGPVELKTR